MSCCVSQLTFANFPFIEEQRRLASLAVALTFDKVKVLSPLMNWALIKSASMIKHLASFCTNYERNKFKTKKQNI